MQQSPEFPDEFVQKGRKSYTKPTTYELKKVLQQNIWQICKMKKKKNCAEGINRTLWWCDAM